MIVGHFLQLVVRPVLHRVLDEHVCRIGAQCLGLNGGGVDEFGGGDTDRRDSVGLKIREVMRTARRAASSVRQPFDDDIHLAHDLLA